GADRAGFSAVLVHDDFRLLSGSTETVADEIHFRFDDSEVILRAALQHEPRTQSCKVGNAGDVEKYILWQHRCQTGEDFLRAPPLALEIHDVRLHEYRAAVAKNRHGLRGKSQVGVLIHIEAEAFRRGLQEIPIPRGALGVELEILHPAVVQDDNFDVLPANIHDHMRIFIELQG